MDIKRYNLRVYGLLIRNREVLITYEYRNGIIMRKFPGGGLEMGEGLADCLKREFVEELDLEVDVLDVFYVNEFLQRSKFKQEEQLISFYYKVKCAQDASDPLTTYKEKISPGEQQFQWVNIQEIEPENMTFPIDKEVAFRLKETTESI